MFTHIYPTGENFIQHNGVDCVCKPVVTSKTVASVSGRGGRKQGYNNFSKTVTHNPLKVPATA